MHVLTFKGRSAETDIPTPLNYQPGRKYLGVEVLDESLLWVGVRPGAVLIFMFGDVIEGHIHVVEFDGETYVGAVAVEGGEFRFMCWQEHGPSGKHRPDRMKVLGTLVESYPTGIPGPRWAFSPPVIQVDVKRLSDMLAANAS